MLTFSQKSVSALGTIIIIGAILSLNGNLLTSTASFLPIVLAMSIAPLMGALICLIFANGVKPPDLTSR